MATAAELLAKSNKRRSKERGKMVSSINSNDEKKSFKPVKSRCWDFNDTEEVVSKSTNRKVVSQIEDANSSVSKTPSIPNKQTKKIENSNCFNSTKSFFTSYSGLHKEILILLHDLCSHTGRNLTPPVAADYLSSQLGNNITTVRTAISRLKRRGAIELVDYKDGRSGWSRYKLDDDLFRDMSLLSKNNYRESQGDIVLTAKSVSTSKIGAFSKKEKDNDDLPGEWKNIKLESLNKVLSIYHNTFSIRQLISVYRSEGKKLTAKQIQDSIDQFSYGLNNFPEEGFYKRQKPVASLLEHLKEGRAFVEPRYLTSEDKMVYNIYKKLMVDLEENKMGEFSKWISTDKEKKEQYYKAKKGSTEHWDERVFVNDAKKDFLENQWVSYKRSRVKEFITDSEMLIKFENIYKEESKEV